MKEKIHKAQINLAVYARSRTKGKRMTKKALIDAFYANDDFVTHSVNGQPYGTYCSIRDFADGATVEILERDSRGYYNSVAYFTVDLKKIAADEVPAFMAGLPVEND